MFTVYFFCIILFGIRWDIIKSASIKSNGFNEITSETESQKIVKRFKRGEKLVPAPAVPKKILRTPPKISKYDHTKIEVPITDNTGDTFLNKWNNRNYNIYLTLSNGIKKIQDGVEDLVYSSKLKQILGPLASYSNMATTVLNDVNDKAMRKLYTDVRKAFKLTGEEISPEEPVQNIPVDEEHVDNGLDGLEELANLKKTKE